jgi:hypothetical protein
MLNAFRPTVWFAIYCFLTFPIQAKTVPGGAGEAICTRRGFNVVAATRACCSEVNHKAYYNPMFEECLAHGGPWHSAIQYEAFALCCRRRPDATGSSSNRNSYLKLGVVPDPVFPGGIKPYDGPHAKGKGDGKKGRMMDTTSLDLTVNTTNGG